MGLTDTVAENIDDYVGIASRLGTDTGFRGLISNLVHDRKHLVYEDRDGLEGLECFLREVRDTT